MFLPPLSLPLSPFSSTTILVPRAGARPLRVEKLRPQAAPPKTGQFGLSAEPRPAAKSVSLKVSPPPATAALYVQTPQGMVRSQVFEDWLDAALRRIAPQRPGRIAATYALEIVAPRNARTRQLGALERPLVELLQRGRVIRRGLNPEKFCVSYGGAGSELTLVITDATPAL
jgi:hypothetical protein